MAQYKHIFFDLDHTLWDFDKNSMVTLQKLYEYYDFERLLGFSFANFFSSFTEINFKLWDLYGNNQISKESLRDKRFEWVFEKLGFDKSFVPKNLSADFIFQCPRMNFLMPNTLTLLNYLAEKKYQMHIITNGFQESQMVKIQSSGLEKYFQNVITSESIGNIKKPDTRIFEFALKKSFAQKNETIMVGDRFETDIIGAVNTGIDAVFYGNESYDEKIRQHQNTQQTYIVRDLIEICTIL